MGQVRSAVNKGLVVVFIVFSLSLFLLGYSYLGALKGHPLFVFAIETVFGNMALLAFIALYVYHTLKALTVAEYNAEVLEILYSVLLIFSSTLVIYPVVMFFIGNATTSGRFLTLLATVFLSVLTALPILTEKIHRAVYYAGLTASAVIVVIVLAFPEPTSEFFMNVVESIRHLGDLFRGLGLI